MAPDPLTTDVQASMSLEFERCLEILSQPVSRTVQPGGAATLAISVDAANQAGAVTFEWFWNWPCQTGTSWISVTSPQVCIELADATPCANTHELQFITPSCTGSDRLLFTATGQGTRELMVTLNGYIKGLEFYCDVRNACDAANSGIVSVITCPGDIDHSATVGVDDLLGVITSWGSCAGCPADLVPTGGNGAVNVDDLLAVLTGWGSCH